MDQTRYPRPDLLVENIPGAKPSGWFTMAPDEKGLRGRYALIAMLSGISAELAWYYAMKADALEVIEKDIGHVTDEQIEEWLADTRSAVLTRTQWTRSASHERR